MSSGVSEQELTIVRTFDAPRERVFRAFAEAERLARWWGPKGFEIEVGRLEFAPGGVFHYAMRAPKGMEMWGKFVYREIVEPERIVYVSSFSDAEGGLTRHPMWPEWPLEVLNTLTLEEQGHQTVLTLRGGPVNATEREIEFFNRVQSGVKTGFGATFDQLEAFLEEDRAIVVSRVIDAPRERVFRAFGDAANIGRWWGPDGFSTTVHAMEFRAGGEWRYTMHAPDGTDYPNKATYLEIAEPERIVYDHGDLESVHFRSTVTFVEQGGKTEVTLRAVFPSKEVRDEAAKYAVEGGEQNLARLENYLNKGEAMSKTITVSTSVAAPLQTAWDAYTQPQHITRWNFASDDWQCPKSENDLRVGGLFSSRMEAKDGSYGFEFGGYYTAVEPLRRIGYVMGEIGDMAAGRKAEVVFESAAPDQTTVTVTFDAEDQNPEEMQRDGWQAILENYRKHAESLA